MVLELFFYILPLKVGWDFVQNPLTHTVTHITIIHSGHGGTRGLFLVTTLSEIEKPSGICL